MTLREPYVFRYVTVPGEEGELQQGVRYTGKVRRVRAVFAAGQAGSLRLRPVIVTGKGRVKDLLHYPGDVFLAGDGVERDLSVDVPVKAGDSLEVWYENASGTYDREVVVDIEIQMEVS